LTQIAGSDAEALVVHATPGEGAPLTVQYRDLGLEAPIVHNHGIGNQAFIDLAGEAAEGVLFPIGKLLVASANCSWPMTCPLPTRKKQRC
jgi:branched-chain amino acid transport system substrate-binding protein